MRVDHDKMPTLNRPGELDYTAHAKFALLGPWAGGSATSLNPGWDGKIRYANGAVFDALASMKDEPYKSIAVRK